MCIYKLAVRDQYDYSMCWMMIAFYILEASVRYVNKFIMATVQCERLLRSKTDTYVKEKE